MRSVLIQLADDARPRKRKEEARINRAMVVVLVGFWEKNKEKGGRRGGRSWKGRERGGWRFAGRRGWQTLAAYANTLYTYLAGIKKPSFSSNALFPPASTPFPRPVVPYLSRTSWSVVWITISDRIVFRIKRTTVLPLRLQTFVFFRIVRVSFQTGRRFHSILPKFLSRITGRCRV